jgi:flagellar hook-associated protein 3 FlgL
MNGLSLGDLATSFMLQNRGSALKNEMSRLTQELTSGQVSDVKSVLDGNYSYLTGIESSMSRLQGYKTATAEAAQFAGSMQSVLEKIQESTSNLGTSLILVSSGGLDNVVQQSGNEAFATLQSTMSAFNTDIAGRSLFSGAASDQPALGSADDLMTELRSIVIGISGSVAKISAIQNWFDDPAGFDALTYSGSNTGISPFQLTDSETLSLDIKATNTGLKDTLMNLAIATIAADEALTFNHTERSALLLAAGEGMMQNQDDLTSLRAQIGFAEARIDNMAIRNASESVSLEYAKGTLLAADPYETATRLEEVQFQLQSLYAVTVKASQLSLVNFL